jgi:hypothetical protein
MADIYGSLPNKSPVSLDEFRQILVDSISLDDYIRIENGSLVGTFQPKKRIPIEDIERYSESIFYQQNIDKKDSQYYFLEDTISSFENFQRYLLDKKTPITHLYIWDSLSSKNPLLFPDGLNIIIIEKSTTDLTENVQLLCSPNPTNYYDETRETVLIYKFEDLYEPIYLYTKKGQNDTLEVIKRFHKDTFPAPYLEKLLKTILLSTNQQCKSTPTVYNFKVNISAMELKKILESIGYSIEFQVVNYNRKVIGMMVSKVLGSPLIMIPSSPSSILMGEGKTLLYPIKYMDDIIWQDYKTTKTTLSNISIESQGKILCEPQMKVIENNLIVGILTETNQFLQIDPPITFDKEDQGGDDYLKPFEAFGYKEKGYFIADKALTINPNQDEERIKAIHNITLETKFYIAFRNTIRLLLNDYENKDVRRILKEELEKKGSLYSIQLKKVFIILQFLLQGRVEFFLYDKDKLLLLKELEEITSCHSNSSLLAEKPYCGIKDNNGVLYIPKNNLVDERVDNERNYINRVADELIRHKRIRNYIFEPKKYLNITNLEYKINQEEILLLESLLENYLKNMKVYTTNNYIQNIPYELAVPSNYQNTTKRVEWKEEQQEEEEEEENLEIEGSQQGGGGKRGKGIKIITSKIRASGFWKNVFPKNTVEIQYYKNRYCSFVLLQTIYHEYFQKEISIQEIKNALWVEYSSKISSSYSKLIELFKEEGKKWKDGKMEEIIKGDTYVITKLDIWTFGSHFNIPIVLYSNKNGQLFRLLDANWILCNTNHQPTNTTDKYFFVYSNQEKIPEYSLIETSGFPSSLRSKIRNPDYPIHNKKLDAFLSP